MTDVTRRLTAMYRDHLRNPTLGNRLWATFFTRVSRYQKGKPIWILPKQETVSGSGTSWAIRKQSAPRSRQMTRPAPHHSVFTGRILFLPPNQQCQSTEGTGRRRSNKNIIEYTVNKHQLWRIGPRDKIVLQTELDDLCDKLQWSSVGAGGIINSVDRRRPSLSRSERPPISS